MRWNEIFSLLKIGYNRVWSWREEEKERSKRGAREREREINRQGERISVTKKEGDLGKKRDKERKRECIGKNKTQLC